MSRRNETRENRDPNNINGHLTISVDDVLGERYDPKSIECIWDFSKIMYTCCQQCCYGIFTAFFGCWLALYWGVCFGLLAFQQVWCCRPQLTVCEITMGSLRRCVKACLDCCIAIPMRSFGGIFIAFHRESEEKPVIEEVKKPKQETLPVPAKTQRESSYIGNIENAQKSVSRQLGLFMSPKVTPKETINDYEW